jgi:DNA repair exonuclease SbcCD ATPase subunit
MKLYDITTELREALDPLAGDVTDASAEVLAKLEHLEMSLEDKVDGVLRRFKEWEAEAEALRAEEDRLKARRKTLESTMSRLRQYLEASLVAGNLKQVRTKLFTVALQKSPPRVAVDNEMDVPGHYHIVETVIDKRKLLEDLKAGIAVPGAHLENGQSLRIR